MTVQSAASRNSYTASGGTTFPYTFLCLLSTDLAVYDNTTLVATSAYTVTNTGAAGGGNVVFGVAPTSGHTIIILSAAAYTQGLDLVENDPLPAASTETAFDRNTILSKQLKEITDRALKFDVFVCDHNIAVDTVIGQAGKVLSVAASETRIEHISVSQAQAAATGTFTATGIGATTRTVSSKLNDFVSVKDFGAVGDGLVNDTAAFQAALNAYGAVFVPGGRATVYMITSIAIPNHTTLFGLGATIRQIAGTNSSMIVAQDTATATGLTLDGLTIDHNGPNVLGNTVAILFNCCTRVLITNNVVLNARVHAIQLANIATDSRIENNLVDTFGTGGLGSGVVLFRGASRNAVVGNLIRNGAAGTYGVLIDDASTSSTDSVPSNDNTISGNVISTVAFGVGVEGSLGNTVCNNVIDGIASGTGIDVSQGFGNAQSCDTMIAGNIVRNVSGGGNGIRVVGSNIIVENNLIATVTSTGRGIVLLTEAGAAQRNITIRNNTLRDQQATQAIRIAPTTVNNLVIEGNLIDSSADNAIDTTGGGSAWSISGNRILTAFKAGISVGAGTLSGLRIAGNTIRNVATSAPATFDAITVNGAAITRVQIADNMIIDDQATRTTRNAVSVSAATHVEVRDNFTCGQVGVVLTGTASTADTGAPKAWLVFDGTAGSPITPTLSYNIKDNRVTRIGATGDYCVSFERAFNCSRYVLHGTAMDDGTNFFGVTISLLNTGCCRFFVRRQDGTLSDRSLVGVSFFGTQA